MNIEKRSSRYLLSASVASGTLTILGTAAVDHIVVAQETNSSLSVRQDDVIQSFPTDGLGRIIIQGDAGNDSLIVTHLAARYRVSIIGGTGDDYIEGAIFNQNLFG